MSVYIPFSFSSDVASFLTPASNAKKDSWQISALKNAAVATVALMETVVFSIFTLLTAPTYLITTKICDWASNHSIVALYMLKEAGHGRACRPLAKPPRFNQPPATSFRAVRTSLCALALLGVVVGSTMLAYKYDSKAVKNIIDRCLSEKTQAAIIGQWNAVKNIDIRSKADAIKQYVFKRIHPQPTPSWFQSVGQGVWSYKKTIFVLAVFAFATYREWIEPKKWYENISNGFKTIFKPQKKQQVPQNVGGNAILVGSNETGGGTSDYEDE